MQNVIPQPAAGATPPGFDAAAAAAFAGKPIVDPTIIDDPYQNDVELLKTFAQAKRECYDRISTFSRIWWRNLLYDMGRQWIYYERNAGAWLDKRLQRWIPKPVTNKIEETRHAIESLLDSVNLTVNCRPIGQDPKDIQAADTANKYEGPIRIDHDMDRVERATDYWRIVTGEAWWYVWWDKSGEGQFTFVPWEQCMTCGETYSPKDVKAAGDICPGCGSMLMQDAVDPETGQRVGAKINTGRGRTDAYSPFQIGCPPVFEDADDSPVLICARWRTKHYYEQILEPDVLEKINWESMTTDRSLQLLRSVSTASEVGGGQASMTGGETSEMQGTTEYELWMKPCKKYSKGLVMRVIDSTTDGAGGVILKEKAEGYPGPIPMKTPDGKIVWPWIHVPYEKVGGRLHGRSPFDCLIDKQNQLNQLDSLSQLIVQRTANPVWLEPKGAEVKKFTGEPGLVVKYSPLLGANGAKPEKIEGSNVPASLINMRKMLLEDIEQLAGTFDIIKGQKPTGVEAFSALQLLVERSQSRFGPMLKSRGRAYKRWFQIALEFERAFGPVERAYAILGPNGTWQLQAFKKANLSGAVRVEVEDGSQMPKTSLGKRAAIEQLAQLGVIDPRNPDTGYRILQTFGQTDLWPGLDMHVKAAQREQQEFEEWAMRVQFAPPEPEVGPTGAYLVDPANPGQPIMGPPMPSEEPPGSRHVWHNDQVHVEEHKKWANGDTVQQLLTEKPEIEQWLTIFIQQHEDALMEQAAIQAQAQAAVTPGAKGVGGGRAMKNSNQESGKTGDVPSGNKQGAPNQGPQ